MTFIDLLSAYHIMPQFPPGAVREAEKMPKEVTPADCVGRKDLTDKLIITIDGEDAKDFDDGVSIELMENGNYCLGVHIADVTHYVTENSPIDRAAFSRGTSVYLIDTVIPMLPFELSNELCSLKPNEIRLAVSVFMEISPRGKVKSYNICESFIRSHDRMTYADVTKILEGDEKLCVKYSHLVSMLHQMKRLAGILNKKRVADGSIEFETHESKITLDKDGRPINVEKYPITQSNNIIEEFMLICNVTVAKHLTDKGLPCVYRIHEQPDLMRLERLGQILPVLGVDFQYSTDMNPKDFQRILCSVAETPQSVVVSYLILRAMSKAKYNEKNMGHFGLAFDTYCHFTSPIRRYADVAVHRVLKESLKGELSDKRKNHFKELAISASVTASVTEVNAADAELDWKSVKKAEFMTDKIGEKFDGLITHVVSSGFFVELENTVEGFVAARTLEDDVYVISDNGVSMTGLKTKRSFTVGDRVKIKVSAVDAERQFVDFEVLGAAMLKPQRRKSQRKDGAKPGIGKKERKILREITDAQREERLEKADARKKADAERQMFENAVVSALFDMLAERYKFNKAEKRFAGVTLQDLAANISSPVYKTALYENTEYSVKNALISASVNVKNTVNMLGDSFGFDVTSDMEKFASEFVCAALRHLDVCLRHREFNFSKRENQYYSLIKKVKSRKGISE